jgi:hypothetical protein
MALDYVLGIIQFIHFLFKTVYHVSDPLYTMSMVHTPRQAGEIVPEKVTSAHNKVRIALFNRN